MKKVLLTLAIVLLAVAVQAQIKLHQNGQVSLGTLSNSFNQGIQIEPTCCYFNTTNLNEYGWVSMSHPKRRTTKSWIVTDSISQHSHVFSVTGEGAVYYGCLLNRGLDGAMNENPRNRSERIDGEEALSIINQISGFYYEPKEVEIPNLEGNEYVAQEAIPDLISDYSKRIVGLSARELSEVFPDAVRSDSDGHKCIDYNSVLTMLVEAFKQQQARMDGLENVLKKNGLIYEEKRP
jgi:hypothetical protein